MVLCISFSTMAGNRPFNRLERLYHSNPTKCLKVSKRYIKYLPDNPVAYYFASMVYRDKSKTHLETKTRYMMMSKSIGYAMKFENFEDLDLENKIRWEAYLDELRDATDLLVDVLGGTELANLGDRLAIKHQKMTDNRNEIVLIADNGNVTGSGSLEESTQNDETAEEPNNSDSKGYFGLASGRENTPSFNEAKELELLELINEERKALFMSPLKLEGDLNRAARYHAFDMASQDYFYVDSYDRVNGELVQVAYAMTRNAQFRPKSKITSQNIACGSENASDAFSQWLMYDDQYDVLFDESSKKVGIGICYDPTSTHGYYWVLITTRK